LKILRAYYKNADSVLAASAAEMPTYERWLQESRGANSRFYDHAKGAVYKQERKIKTMGFDVGFTRR
jgi:hypothetical protein